jgi:NADPH:quinone reductase-like Zn-dependent oxidoreductase
LQTWPVKGKRVLLTGAGSACAAILAQWSYHAGALEVVGIYRSPAHVVFLSQLGVRPVDMTSATEIDAVLAKTDIAFDAVGGALGTSTLAGLGLRGEFVSYGLLSGEPFQATLHGVHAQRFHLRDCLEATTPAEWQQWFCELWPLLKRTQLPVIIPVPLRDWQQALSLFHRRGRLSKPVLTMGEVT